MKVIPKYKGLSKTEKINVDFTFEEWVVGNSIFLNNYLNSNEFKNGFLQSKFKSITGYDKRKEGYILLQDHGHNVAFKNIKIKELD